VLGDFLVVGGPGLGRESAWVQGVRESLEILSEWWRGSGPDRAAPRVPRTRWSASLSRVESGGLLPVDHGSGRAAGVDGHRRLAELRVVALHRRGGSVPGRPGHRRGGTVDPAEGPPRRRDFVSSARAARCWTWVRAATASRRSRGRRWADAPGEPAVYRPRDHYRYRPRSRWVRFLPALPRPISQVPVTASTRPSRSPSTPGP
jgi:hypothetical protein